MGIGAGRSKNLDVWKTAKSIILKRSEMSEKLFYTLRFFGCTTLIAGSAFAMEWTAGFRGYPLGSIVPVSVVFLNVFAIGISFLMLYRGLPSSKPTYQSFGYILVSIAVLVGLFKAGDVADGLRLECAAALMSVGQSAKTQTPCSISKHIIYDAIVPPPHGWFVQQYARCLALPGFGKDGWRRVCD
jgi:hypothetical protein